MTTTNCYLIATENLFIEEQLITYLTKINNHAIVKVCNNMPETLCYLIKQEVDLLILDNDIDNHSGLMYLKSLKNIPTTMLLSQCPIAAVEAFDIGIQDFLLKPFSLERFAKALIKLNYVSVAINMPNVIESTTMIANEVEPVYIFVKANGRNTKLILKDILLLEAAGNYIKIILKNRNIITLHLSLNYFEQVLPPNKFVRIHKSFIIALEHIQSANNRKVWVDNIEIPVSRTYKHHLQQHLTVVN